MHYGRRDILRLGSLVAGCACLPGSILLNWSPAHAATAKVENRVLSAGEYDFFAYLGQVMLPVEGTPLPSPEEAAVLATLDNVLLAGMAPHVREQVKGAVAQFQQWAMEAHGKPFTQWPLDQARTFCDNLSDGKLPQHRGIIMLLRKLMGLSYWSNPITWGPLGYKMPISKGNPDYPQLGNAPLPA